VDPLSPQNKLIFATGPLTATTAPTGNRYMVVTKSPLTGALAHSNSGGDFPTWMKRTGYDMFIFEGRAFGAGVCLGERGPGRNPAGCAPVGQGSSRNHRCCSAETDPEAQSGLHRPGGENLVLMAAIMNDKHRAAARSGVGAVMGSKNLKGRGCHGQEKPGFLR
jgi:aldehyde:ferredoxin oxidoreductase